MSPPPLARPACYTAARIDVETLKTFPAFNEFYGQAGTGAEPDQVDAAVAAKNSDATPEEQIDAAHAVVTAALKADLLQRVLEQSPAFFERLIVDLLVAMGYGGSHEDAARQLVNQATAASTASLTKTDLASIGSTSRQSAMPPAPRLAVQKCKDSLAALSDWARTRECSSQPQASASRLWITLEVCNNALY